MLFVILVYFCPRKQTNNRIYMKTNEKYGAYEAPRVKVIEVEVEKGFQVSPYDMTYGNDPFATNP